MTTLVTITQAITAVDLAERVFARGTEVPRNQSHRELAREHLKGAAEYLRELKEYHDGRARTAK